MFMPWRYFFIAAELAGVNVKSDACPLFEVNEACDHGCSPVTYARGRSVGANYGVTVTMASPARHIRRS
jgi:hypothetical protein